jgi:putative transcriptional regulator
MPSLRGHFLLASPSMRDANFVESAIFMIRHGPDGALGLIVNKPLEITVEEACTDQLPAAEGATQPLLRGGPCDGPLMAITGLSLEGTLTVMPGVHFAVETGPIETLLRENLSPSLFFAGYAGWAADQLETELAEGSWEVLPANIDDIFHADDSTWSRLMTRAKLLKHIRADQIPHAPDLN